MRNRRLLLITTIGIALALAAVACGSDGDGDAPTPSSTQATVLIDPTEEALSRSLGGLQRLTITPQEAPDGYELRSSQAVSKSQVVAANIGIPPLAQALDDGDLLGAWATFYVRPQPETGLSSIVYAYPEPGGPAAHVAAVGAITASAYPAATSVERLQSETVGEVSQMMLYRLPGARIMDLTWAQGRYTGQIVLRYAGEEGDAGDAALLTSLAKQQAGRMAAAP